MPSTISIDSTFAQEIVEFWVHKYKEIKEELANTTHNKSQVEAQNETQTKALQDLIQEFQQEHEQRKTFDGELRSLLAQVQSQNVAKQDVPNKIADVTEKLLRVQTANEDISRRLAVSESEKMMLTQQIKLFCSQAAILAVEADSWRREKVRRMFEPVNFVEDTFRSRPMTFTHPQLIVSALSDGTCDVKRLHFLPRPPTCMPLRVPSCGKHGYWFYPAWIFPDDAEFELIVEGRPSEWSYLGRYVTAILPGGEMRLSEWMSLDEETKIAHCMRIAYQNSPQTTQIASSTTHLLEVKRRYESGAWSVPCFTLRCVGFDKSLHESLQAAIAATNKSSISSSNGGLQKRKSDTQEDHTRMNPSTKKARSCPQVVKT